MHPRSSKVSHANSDALATGELNTSSSLAVGDRGINSGDASGVTAVVDALNNNQSFAAAGDFSSKNMTLSSYASALISDAATQASSAQTNADAAQATSSYLSDKLSSETGVNTDEETANLTALQNYYSATAQVISTVRSLFSTLIQAYE